MKMNERALRQLIRESLLAERIVTFDGEEYDLPKEEITKIKDQLEMGYVGVGMPDEPPDRRVTAENIVKMVAKSYASISNMSEDELAVKLESFQETWDNVFAGYGTKALLALQKFDNPTTPLFQSSIPSAGGSAAVEADMVPVAEISKTNLGQGELAATLMWGGSPAGGTGGKEVDITLGNGESWHVKWFSNTSSGAAKWGPAGSKIFYSSLKSQLPDDEFKILHRLLKQGNFARSGTKDAKFNPKKAALRKEWYQGWGVCLDKAMAATAAAGAIGMLALAGNTFYFIAAKDVKYAQTTENGRLKVMASVPGTASGGSYEDLLKSIIPGYDALPKSTCIGGSPTAGPPGPGHIRPGVALAPENSGKVYDDLRSLIRESLLAEELTKSDKKAIEKIAKQHAKSYFDAEITKVLDKELGKSFFGNKGKINKFVEDEVTSRFKNANQDKDFDAAVIKVSRRVLKGLYDMHYKRSNLINNMPIPN